MSSAGSKQIVFDASAVLALMQGEPGSEKLRELQPQAIVNAVNVAEVLAKLVSRGMPPGDAREALDALHLEAAPFDAMLAVISARYVARNVSLGDRCFLAAAFRHGAGWTSDHDLAHAAGKHGPTVHFFR